MKDEIGRTNKVHPERDLLQRLNLQITVRLIIDGAFEQSHPEVTRQFRNLRDTCPGIFDRLLPPSERLQPPTAGDLNDDGYLDILADEQHTKPTVISRLANAYCRDKLQLAVRPAQIKPAFAAMLTAAYARDYGRENVMAFGILPIKYWKKLAFDDSTLQRRVVLNRGDSIRYYGDSIGQITQILTIANVGVLRVFLLMQRTAPRRMRDPILDLP